MDIEAGFLHDIRERPDDDGPRLIYADWVEDNGDPERAEFIRTQVARARLPGDAPEAAALLAREEALLERHRRRWLGELGRLGKDHGFRRGLVEAVTFTPARLLAEGPALFRQAPIRELRLDKAAGDLAAVARMPELRQVARLHLTGRAPSGARLRALFDSANLRGVRALSLDGLTWGRAGLGLALVGSPLLPRLKELNLSNGEVDAELVTRLLEGATGGLTRLHLRNNPLNNDGARVIAESPQVRAVEDLDLAYTGLTREAGPPLAASPYLRRLRRLDLHFGTLNGPGGAAVAGSPILANVVELNIGFNEITDEGARALAASPHLGQLRVLNLNHSELTAGGVAALASSAVLGRLRELYLGYNLLGDQGVTALASSPGLASVRRLNLCDNLFGRLGAEALAASPYTANLTFLAVEGNRIQTAGARALARSPHLGCLVDLVVVAEGDMGVRGLAALRKRFGDGLKVC